MSKKRTLAIDYTPDFRAVGIFTAQKDYRLCWLLDQYLRTAFQRLPDFSFVSENQKPPLTVPVFRHTDRRLLRKYFLLPNKLETTALFQKPANMDYLFLVQQPSDQFDMQRLIKEIRNIPQVNTAIEAGPFLGKAANSFYFEFEHYLVTCCQEE